jgi:exosortase family protein XrtG
MFSTAILLWLGATIFLRQYRIWIIYYIVGTVGLVYWLALLSGDILGLEPIFARSIAWSVHIIANTLGIPTHIFQNAPGVLLVLVVIQKVGWTVLHVGVESSGLLEISVLVSILVFYPGWSFGRKLRSIMIGGSAVWGANLVRMLVIVAILNHFGKGSLVLAHTLVGRVLFFFFTVIIFWYLITSNTLSDLRDQRDSVNQQAEAAG